MGGFFAINTYISNQSRISEEEQNGDGPQSNMAEYFQEKMIALGVEKVGQPIEGFDAQLLITAFPGLEAGDFERVETLEGHYEVNDGQIMFVRGEQMPITSAEKAISDKGYATLLTNISGRLQMLAQNDSQIDLIISAISGAGTAEIKAGIAQRVSAGDEYITVLEVLEDSRCPIDAECIWAGTVRLNVLLETKMGDSEQIFELGKSGSTEINRITLTRVDPHPQAGTQIDPGDYVFTFNVEKRKE